MSKQNLDDYITCVASKVLRPVEIDHMCSNQHELNGVSSLKKIFGDDSSKKNVFPTTFAYLSDDESSCSSQGGTITWYDARADHPTRSEFRLYYTENGAFSSAKPGDDLFIIQKRDGTFITAVCEAGSVVSSQVRWLLDVKDDENKFKVREIPAKALSYPVSYIMDLIGIEPVVSGDRDIETLLATYTDFPSCTEFSNFARGFVDEDPVNHPDRALVSWIKKEDEFFKALEQHIIMESIQSMSARLANGSDPKELTELYIKESLSIQNRRKSRAGKSFEEHLKELFDRNGVKYSYQPITENGNKPDFIMPSIELYRDPAYDASNLTMLGAKTTCKDRWRQIIEEANRIPVKHLATIEPAISTNQCAQMKASNVQLVVPESIRDTYPEKNKPDIWNMEMFIGYAQEKQSV